jgi:succinyl-diaminopimelate desuccinylase
MTFSSLPIAQKLVSFPSITPEDCGVQDYLKSLLIPMGFEIFDLPFEGNGGTYPVQNFFARLGTSSPHICFAGHTDVVPPGDVNAWSVPPFEGAIRDGKLIGRGTSDMKANIAAFVAAIQNFVQGSPNFKGSISLLITGDEEKESINGTARVLEWMKGNKHVPDVCLVAEPSNPDFMGQEIRIGRRGSLTGYLTVRGKQGHVAYPDRAQNPLPRLVQYLDALTKTKLDEGSEFFPPSSLQITTIDVGNPSNNVIPAMGKATFNIRFSDIWSIETLEEKIKSILNTVDENYEISFTRGARSFLTKPGAWTKLVAEIVEDITGHKPVLGTGGGTSDARFVAGYCPVVEFGLINQTIHQVDEHCTLDDLEKCETIYHEILKRYFA